MSNFWGSHHEYRGRGPLDTSPGGAQETVGGAGVSEANGVPQEGVSAAGQQSKPNEMLNALKGFRIRKKKVTFVDS